MATKEMTLLGMDVREGSYEPTGQPVAYFYRDPLTNSAFAIDQGCASRHVLFLGSSGSGKTNAINLTLTQARKNPLARDSVLVIFDPKGDYYANFCQAGDEALGTRLLHAEKRTTWNVFSEVLANGYDMRDVEDNAREIASELFVNRGSQTQPFFADAAREVFANLIIYLIRRSQENPEAYKDQLNNAELRRMAIKVDARSLTKLFSVYDDMSGLVSFFGDGTTAQGLGVLGEMKSMVYDCFQGAFAERPTPGTAGFGIREFVRNKGGKAVFVEYDLTRGLALQPVYRLLVDLAIKESLGSDAWGKTLFFLDELSLLPQLQHLDDALAFGRSKGVQIVAGLQSSAQMTAAYGEERGKVVLGGFGSLVAMRTSDSETCDFVSEHFGTNVKAYRYTNWNRSPVDRQREGNVVEPWVVRSLEVGEAVVGLSTQASPFLFRFEKDGRS